MGTLWHLITIIVQDMFASITSWIMNGKYDGIIHPGAFLPMWRWHSPEAKGWSQRHCLGWLVLIFPHHTSVDTETFLQERFRFSRWKFTLKSGTLLGVAGADVPSHISVSHYPPHHTSSAKKKCAVLIKLLDLDSGETLHWSQRHYPSCTPKYMHQGVRL